MRGVWLKKTKMMKYTNTFYGVKVDYSWSGKLEEMREYREDTMVGEDKIVENGSFHELTIVFTNTDEGTKPKKIVLVLDICVYGSIEYIVRVYNFGTLTLPEYYTMLELLKKRMCYTSTEINRFYAELKRAIEASGGVFPALNVDL